MRYLTPTVTLLALLAGCRSSDGPRPEDVPTQTQLAPNLVEVLQVNFEATDAGYTLVQTSRAMGAPTLAIDQGRDVLITAKDAAGRPLRSISVYNPRQVRTAGSTDPAQAVLDLLGEQLKKAA